MAFAVHKANAQPPQPATNNNTMNQRRSSADRYDARRSRRRNDYRDDQPYEEPVHVSYDDERCHPENPLDEPDGVYGAFYRLIFAFVYAVLNFILAPVIKSSSRRRSSSRERPSDYYCHDRRSSDYDHVEEGYARPQYSEPESPVNKTRAVEPNRKVVQFTPQRKSHRPPLGRIALATKSSSSSSVSSSSTASTSSTSSSDSSGSGGFRHSSPSYRVHRSLDRVLAVSTPRTSHSSYFVGNC